MTHPNRSIVSLHAFTCLVSIFLCKVSKVDRTKSTSSLFHKIQKSLLFYLNFITALVIVLLIKVVSLQDKRMVHNSNCIENGGNITNKMKIYFSTHTYYDPNGFPICY